MTVNVTRLPSGLQVVTHDMPELETAALGVFVGAGSRHETESEHGLSHLLEHMAFKGTRRRRACDIAEEIEAVGGELNASTSVDQTAYLARVLARDVDLALDILSDILTDSVFDDVELAREKNVVLQEIAAAEDSPEELIFDLFSEAAFADQPIGRPILGTADTVVGFSREAVGAYLDRHYAAPAVVVAASGAVRHEAVLDAAARRFGGFRQEPPAQPEPARYIGGDKRVRRKLEQTHLVVGFEGLDHSDADVHAAQIFANAVGEGMSSRLFQEIREKRGLAYSVYSFHWSFADSGLFGFYLGAKPEDVDEAARVALDCLSDATASLTEAEARRAKAQMKMALLAALESPTARTEQIARQLAIFGRILTKAELVERIDGLDLEQIRRAGARLLSSAPTVAAIGSLKRTPDSSKIARILGRG